MAIDTEAAAATPSTPVTLFTDDVVSNSSDPSRIGVITRTAVEDEEEEDDAEDEPYEDGEAAYEDDRIPPNHARVLWLPPDLWLADHPAAAQAEQERATGFSTVVDVSTLGLVDRSLLHGDVVVRASDPLGLMGHVVDVSVSLDLTLSATRSLTSVPSDRLSFVHPFQSGVYVTANDGLWLGFVDECWCDVSLRFGDGSECTVSAARGRDLRDPRHSDEAMVDEGKSSLFYPGQELTGRAAVWRQAEWHKGTKSSPARFNHTGVVYRVRPVRVLVQWVTGPDQYSEAATEVDLNDTPLKVLSCYEHARMMLGDRVMLSDELMRERFGEEEAKSTTESNAAETEPVDDAKAADDAAGSAAAGGKKLTAADKRRLKRARASQRRQQTEQQDEGRRCALITRSHTTVSILWQDGTREDNIPSTALLPRTDLIDNDFMPTDYVLVRGSQRLAIVLSVNPTDRTCRVRWLDPIADDVSVPFPADESEVDGGGGESDANALGPRRAGEEAEVSIFDVVAHPRLELSLSSHVVRVPGAEEGDTSADIAFGTAGQVIGFVDGQLRVMWADAESSVSVVQADQVWNVDQAEGVDEEDYEGEEDEYPVDEDGNPVDLSQYEVVHNDELEEGERGGIAGVLGSWISAFTGGAGGAASGQQQRRQRRTGATVEEIPSGGEEEGEDDEDEREADDEQDDDEEAEDDEEDEDEDDEDNEEDDEAHDEEEEEEEEAEEQEQPAAKLSATEHSTAAQQASAAAVPPSQPSTSDGPAQPANAVTNGQTVLGSTALYSLFFGNKNTTPTASASDSTATTTETQTDTNDTSVESQDGGDSAVDSAVESIDLQSLYSRLPVSAATFASFTVLSNPNSHYFLSVPFPTAPPSTFTKKVRADMRLLRLHLPAGIHVVTYEGRMDLLRAVIVGPRWTPFFSSLFMFDIYLPHTYPTVPPSVHYYSHGLRLHPNLYVDGKVCLSLLNTWNGRTNERWQPESTTLLQVLLSLQGLVLGDSEPFYLEAGLERLRGETQSVVSAVQYNETSVLYSLQCDVSAMQHADTEWLPLLLSHYSAPAVQDVFVRLNEYARVLKAHTDQPATAAPAEHDSGVDEEQKAAIKALFHHFSLPLGKSLLPRGKTAATPAPEAKDATQAVADDEKKSADSTTRAAVDGSKPAMVYMPSVGFLRTLTRDVSKMCAQLERTRAAWEVAVAGAKAEADSDASV